MPTSFFQVIVVGLLFIVACAFFPPLLLAIPLAIFGLIINGLAALFKGGNEQPENSTVLRGRPRVNSRTPRAILEAERQWTIEAAESTRKEVVRLAGQEFTALINRALSGGIIATDLESFLRRQWSIDFAIRGGRLDITEDELVRIAPLLPEITAAFAGAERQVASNRD